MFQHIKDLKQKIWDEANQDLDQVTAAMSNAGVNDGSEKYWKRVLKNVRPPKRPKGTITPDQYKRYRDAKYNYERGEFPNWVGGGHFIEPDTPDVATANGLQDFIVSFLNWSGHNATRINTTGIATKDEQGNMLYRKTTTRKGQSDITATVKGQSWKLEVKINRDKPSKDQLKEQARERRAGGIYEFVKTVDDFFRVYDGNYKQSSIFG